MEDGSDEETTTAREQASFRSRSGCGRDTCTGENADCDVLLRYPRALARSKKFLARSDVCGSE
jgi:hypothetical protein